MRGPVPRKRETPHVNDRRDGCCGTWRASWITVFRLDSQANHKASSNCCGASSPLLVVSVVSRYNARQIDPLVQRSEAAFGEIDTDVLFRL